MTMMHDTPTDLLPTFMASLSERGWATRMMPNDEAVVAELDRVGGMLGTRVPGRAGALAEIIEPRTPRNAHPRSLSAKFGLSALPVHVELGHRPRPCRYILLGCIDPGSPSADTMLLDWRAIGFSSDELDILEAAPILVRNGRNSFYSTILPPNRAFLRYDPGCLEAVEERGAAALDIVQRRLQASQPAIHKWRCGDILIIDNWRMLHGRAASQPSSGRQLARILIDE